MRRLIIIPIVHAASDLGRLQGQIDEAKHRVMSKLAVESGRRAVVQFWSDMRLAITGWSNDFRNLQVYQDALPISPVPEAQIELKIIADLAEKGSENHKLLRWMADQGASIIGTEDPALLIKEYELTQKTLQFYDPKHVSCQRDFEQHCSRQRELLDSRDRFIAQRIENTLLEDGLGLIFLGLLHRLEQHLSSDIEVTYPFGKPVANQVQTV